MTTLNALVNAAVAAATASTASTASTVDAARLDRLEKQINAPLDQEALFKKIDVKLTALTNNIMGKVAQMIPVQSLVR